MNSTRPESENNGNLDDPYQWTERTQSTENNGLEGVPISVFSVQQWDYNDVRRFLPAETKQWKAALFRLAKHFHGRDADKRFAEWRGLVQTGVSDEKVSQEWITAKMNVKYGHRIRLDEVLVRANERGIPAWAQQAVPESVQFQMVLVFLDELRQSIFPAETFFISCRDLASIFAESHQWAARVLRYFCQRQILDLVEAGGPKNRKASRYRFTKGGQQ